MLRSLRFSCFVAAMFAVSTLALSQTKPVPRQPARIGPGFLAQQKVHPSFSHTNISKPSAAAQAALVNGVGISSIPHWNSSFTSGGSTFRYVMAGADPRLGGNTRIGTSLQPILLFFEEFVDGNGNNIVIDPTDGVNNILSSPNFRNSSYTTGITQFGDAVQRAEFFSVMKPNWHTTLKAPRILPAITVVVPFGQSLVFQNFDGKFLAEINSDFFDSQLNTILQLAPFRTDELAMMISTNTLLYNGDPSVCCVLGFHSNAGVPRTGQLQTFLFASWLTPDIFVDPELADVLPLSHEIQEWMNNPFGVNSTPVWQFPDGSGVCQGNLETGDPIEVLPTTSFPVTINGFTYHPQIEALLQWFSRESPSSAIGGAYSYPDTTVLTSPSQPCGSGGGGK